MNLRVASRCTKVSHGPYPKAQVVGSVACYRYQTEAVFIVVQDRVGRVQQMQGGYPTITYGYSEHVF